MLSDAAGVHLDDLLAEQDHIVKRSADDAFFRGNLNLGFVLWNELAERARNRGEEAQEAEAAVNAVLNAAGSDHARAIFE